jgi:hypothetical protein
VVNKKTSLLFKGHHPLAANASAVTYNQPIVHPVPGVLIFKIINIPLNINAGIGFFQPPLFQMRLH